MHKHLRSVSTLAAFLAALTWAACNSSEFGGDSGKTANSKDKGKSERPANSDGDSDAGDGQDSGSDAAGGGIDADGAGGDGIADAGADADDAGTSGEVLGANNGFADSGDDVASAGAIITESEANCLLKKGDNFRILFVFDNSLSTESTDPKNIRLEAGLRLVDQFTDFVKSNPRATFKAATVYFNESAFKGAHGWVKLTEGTRTDIEDDITAATTKPRIWTHVDDALTAAGEMFALDGAKASDKRQRTYMILLSDGEANGAKRKVGDLVPMVTDMVNNRGVAVYSILIGKGRNTTAANLMQALALPAAGVVGKDHVGTYVHAPDAAAIDQAFADFFKKVTGC